MSGPFIEDVSAPCSFFEEVRDISQEEKVGQLFVVAFEGDEGGEGIRSLIMTTHIGGVIYYNLSNGVLDFSS
ncbi:MAG: hypothetical protein ACOYK9_03890, partial [Chlamydiia bacterium]